MNTLEHLKEAQRAFWARRDDLNKAKIECENSDDRWYSNGGYQRWSATMTELNKQITTLGTVIAFVEDGGLGQMEANSDDALIEAYTFIKKVEDSGVTHKDFTFDETKRVAGIIKKALGG